MKNFAKYVFVAAGIAMFMSVVQAQVAGSSTQITGSLNATVSDNRARSSGLGDPAGHIEIIGNDLYAMGRNRNVAKWNVWLTGTPSPTGISSGWEFTCG